MAHSPLAQAALHQLPAYRDLSHKACPGDVTRGCACVGATAASRVDAGKVELDGARCLGLKLPFTISQLTVI